MRTRIAAITITLAALAGGIAPAVFAAASPAAPVAAAPQMHYYE